MIALRVKLLEKAFFIFFLAGFFSLAVPRILSAAEEAQSPSHFICGVYITGIGCGNCAMTDPILFTQLTQRYPNLIIVEYEIYRQKEENRRVKDSYFLTYLPFKSPGVPFLTFNKKMTGVGRLEVDRAENHIKGMKFNPCPMPYGDSVNFEDFDLTNLPGKAKIWTKNRVLIGGEGGDKKILTQLLAENNITAALKGVDFQKVDPIAVEISKGQINFENALMIGSWRLQWNGEPLKAQKGFSVSETALSLIFVILAAIGAFMILCKIEKKENGFALRLRKDQKWVYRVTIAVSMVILALFLIFAKKVSPGALESMGYRMPLWLFTFLIGLVDGFNPCNMFVLTCMLALLVSTSDSRVRLFAVAFSFLFVVFIIYFLFMAAWLNVFKYVSFITPLRIAIGIIALMAGLINCKELIFFRKGISLMIPEGQKEPLMDRMRGMKEILKNGSMPVLISSSVGLAALSSFVELPCTAGFPIIYTSILAAKTMRNSFWYYLYLVYYNLLYILPLIVIVLIFVLTFKARAISKEQVQIIKFIGGFIMILLGIVLLVNPGLIGLSIG